MTNQELNIALAKEVDEYRTYYADNMYYPSVPNYSEDLNEINRIWRTKLDINQKKKYKGYLNEIVFREIIGMNYISIEDLQDDVYGFFENASARQRAQAMYYCLNNYEFID